MVQMSWGEVKTNDSWRLVFEEASKIYNEALQNEDEFVVEDDKKLFELPTVFRLEEDADPNTFYVNASLVLYIQVTLLWPFTLALRTKPEPLTHYWTLSSPSQDVQFCITRRTKPPESPR